MQIIQIEIMNKAYEDHVTKSENESTYCSFAANDLPNQVWGAAVVPQGDSFFLVGGARGDDPDYVWLADIYRYDQDELIKLFN